MNQTSKVNLLGFKPEDWKTRLENKIGVSDPTFLTANMESKTKAGASKRMKNMLKWTIKWSSLS